MMIEAIDAIAANRAVLGSRAADHMARRTESVKFIERTQLRRVGRGARPEKRQAALAVFKVCGH